MKIPAGTTHVTIYANSTIIKMFYKKTSLYPLQYWNPRLEKWLKVPVDVSVSDLIPIEDYVIEHMDLHEPKESVAASMKKTAIENSYPILLTRIKEAAEAGLFMITLDERTVRHHIASLNKDMFGVKHLLSSNTYQIFWD